MYAHVSTIRKGRSSYSRSICCLDAIYLFFRLSMHSIGGGGGRRELEVGKVVYLFAIHLLRSNPFLHSCIKDLTVEEKFLTSKVLD